MSEEPKVRLPLVVKVAVALTFFNSWVLFEETVVDRQGLWRYMPFYKVGAFCTWDAAALLVIIPAVWYALRRRQRRSASPAAGTCVLRLRRCLWCG